MLIVFIMWFLLASLIQIYNEQEQVKKGKTQNVQLEEKGGTRKCNGAKPRAQGDEKFKEKPGAEGKKGSGVLGHDSSG